MQIPSSSATVKSDRPSRPGGCSWEKKISRSVPCSARHRRKRLCSVRSTDSPNRSGWRRCNSSSTVTAMSAGALSSSGTTSLSHTSPSGSSRVRQSRGLRCEGNTPRVSMRRALLTLIPVLAAAASWVYSPRSSLYLITCRSVMRLPGTVAASFQRRTTVVPDRNTHPGGVRQPVRIVVVDRSR